MGSRFVRNAIHALALGICSSGQYTVGYAARSIVAKLVHIAGPLPRALFLPG
ncbi:MAG TPA: hypothetical protein VFA04_18800 [Bryobacteraceae bacterium]|nr:hypothetical protein [Bryobacteraceae bacterium]